MKLAVLLLLSAVQSTRFISEDMKEIASHAPEIAILQNKVEKMQDLKPRLHNAVSGVHDLVRTPIVH